jgi:two-component system OmpR family response regulator
MDVEPLSRGESGVHGSRPTRRRRSANGRKTLVVNDHVEVRSVITESLRQRGFIVIPVRDTDSARVLCERVALDLILLNLVVLEEAQRAFIRLVKRLQPRTRLVAVGVGLEIERECRTLGADEVVQKPLVLKQLDRTINRVLRRHAQRP